ncbi:hypothetical protein E5161_00495 [Cohnella pontilimi]|uniref:Family 10 glycosylhydrolase n=1 Tax=Cohnella pontilimi TaxID=2564100 RepID=A0A4U0FGD2_9BACL|nr:family 10 glycosylhydrolase [Cohnella pontilimi]TJY43920.1 hypothetical protein E5161_00495 [Cohnella pontilimi]
MTFRKWSLWFVAICFIFSFFSVSVHAQTSQVIRIYLDGIWLKGDVDPYIDPKVNLTMVPLRIVSEGLGAKVTWTPKSKMVTIQRSGTVITMIVGQKTVTVNGKKTSLQAPAVLKSSRVMVPLRFVSETLGLQVKWNAATKWIQMISKPGQEIKGAWVSTVFHLDWPSSQSYGQKEVQVQQYVTMLDELQSMGMNAVYVQVRPAADAFYPSAFAPWSKFLTGTQGQNPGYDPLAFMVEETHRRGMEFHAWFNPFRANTGSASETFDAKHVAVRHPEWMVTAAGGKMYINPGIPAARQEIIDAIMEVVRGYDVDGVHLDDYFYPSSGNFDDQSAFLAYNPKQIANLDDWRRDNINEFVRTLGQSIHAVKKEVKFGISPFGVWRNQSADPTGSATNAGITAYDDMHADVRTWIRNNWIDYIMPQIYWSFSYSNARYDVLVDWWAREVDGSNVKLYIGHAPYKLGTSEAGWQTADEIVRQLQYNETRPQVRGDVFFSAKDLRRNPLDIIKALKAYYKV